MQHKRQYGPTVASFPGTAATSKIVSASRITATLPSGANQGHGGRDARRRYEAEQKRGVPGAIKAGAIEIRAGEIKKVSSGPGRLLAPPFGLFLRAALLAHLRRTFR